MVKRLHSYEAHVIAISKTESNLKSLQDECPRIQTICVDLGDWEKTRQVISKLDALDCLVNNAAFIVVKGVMSTTSEEFDRYMLCLHIFIM